MSEPLLSIVIANYNYGRFLEEALKSILSQGMDDQIEIIICDGGSTDNSVEIIKKYANGLPPNTERSTFHCPPPPPTSTSSLITWWCSEPDKGQSDAFNKGFAHAHGRFLTWLNADDVLLPGVIEKLRIAADRHPACEWFVGGVLWLDKEMRVLRCGRGRRFSEVRYREGNVCCWGPSSFFTKRMLDSAGGVDVRYQFTMDSELWLRFAYRLGVRYRPFCKYAWGLRMHEDAKMSGHNFLPDNGTGHKNELEKLKASRHFAQMKQEELWMWEWFSRKTPTWISRIFSASWIQVALAWGDTVRYRGRHYLEMFK